MMKTNKEIEFIANNLLKQYVKRGGAFKVFDEIMAVEGIKFKEINSSNSDFLGSLTKGNSGQTLIMINNAIENLGRKHFTIAHELGHYFLNHSFINNKLYCSKSDIIEEVNHVNSIEREANYFASCFLMPEEKLRNAFFAILINSSKAKINDFLLVQNDFTFGVWIPIRDTLTKRYGVSEAALRYRLQKLGLAKFEFEIKK